MSAQPPLLAATGYSESAGCARVRVFDWISYLGCSAEVDTYVGSSTHSPGVLLRRPCSIVEAEVRLRRLVGEVSNRTVLISRQASPFSNGSVEQAILSHANWSVYDFDDALFATSEQGVRRIWSKMRVWQRAVAAADLVIAGNDYLAEAAAAKARSVVVIPSCVDPNAYSQKIDFTMGAIPTAVWLGSPSTEGSLDLIAGPLLELHRKFGLRLTVISSGNMRHGLLDQIIDRVEWSLETSTDVLSKADLGIMPLKDTQWSRGKCSYKLLQYGAARLPLVGSPIGTNQLVLDRAGGLSPRTAGEWVDSIGSILTASASERRVRGQAARSTVERYYSFAAWSDTWRKAMNIVD